MKDKNFTLKLSLLYCLLAAITLQPVMSQGKIAFVTQAFNGGTNVRADDSICVDALWKKGYVVDTCKDIAMVDTTVGSDSRNYFDRLNAADIVIISRSTNSNNYQTANRPFWLNVRKPIMLASSYIARTNRLNFIKSTSTSATFKRPLQTVAKFRRPNDYIVRNNVTLNTDSTVYFFTGVGEYPLAGSDTLERSSNFKLIASGYDSTKTFPDCILIARLAAGLESFSGSGFIAKSRWTFFCFGASNIATVKTGDTRNNFKFTDDGKKVFFNEIAWLLGDTVQISVPGAPVAIAATNITQTGFSANWNASASATGYRLDVATDANFTSFVTGFNDKDVANVTTFSVTGLTANTAYYYRVRASNTKGTSANSNVINPITLVAIPAAPLTVAATGITKTGFSANWNASATATGYYLDVATDNAFVSMLTGYTNKDIANVTTFSVTGLSPATTYYYRVRAYNGSGTSISSNVITVLSLGTAVNTITASTVKISVNGLVAMESNCVIDHVKVTDVNGSVIFEKDINATATSIDADNWKTGIYIFIIKTQYETITKKLSIIK